MSYFKTGDVVRFKKAVQGYPDITIGKEYLLYESKSNFNEGLFVMDDVGDSNFLPRDYSEFTEIVNQASRRPHYDLRIAHANGADIETSGDNGVTWALCGNPAFLDNQLYRIAVPKAPERVFPETGLTCTELCELFGEGLNTCDGYEKIANAAIRRYIEDTEK